MFSLSSAKVRRFSYSRQISERENMHFIAFIDINQKEPAFYVVCYHFSRIHHKKYQLRRNSRWHSFFLFLSLLSDSNQRPRDYKSRALAN